MWCRAHHLTAGRRNAHDRQTTFVWAIRTETKDSVDSRKTRRIGQNLLTEALRPLRFDECGRERNGVVGECCRPHGILPITSAVATGEVAEARRFGRRVPGTVKCNSGENARVVPQAGAKQL